MTERARPRLSVRLYAALFRRLMPDAFRTEMERPALEAFEDAMTEARVSRGRLQAVRTFVRELRSLFHAAWSERRPHLERRRGLPRWPLTDVSSDLRVGLRHLRRNPGFATVALVALTLGIGANTAIVSLANAVFFEPLPYPEADRLGVLSMELTINGESGFSASYLDLRDLTEQNRVFEDVAMFLDWQSVNLSGGDRPERIPVNFVTPRYLALLDLRAARGRLLTEEDGGDEMREPVVVLSHALWQRNFGGDPDVLGRKAILNGLPFEIVGVLAEDAHDLERFGDISGAYIPLAWVPRLVELDLRTRRNARYLYGLTRRRPDVSSTEAREDVRRISARLAREYPDTNEGWRFVLQPLPEVLFGRTRESTLILLAGAGLVLLLVCANLAGLLLIQSVLRSRELAVRRALGAGSGRVRRQLLTESLLLSLIGGLCGTVVAYWGTRTLASLELLQLPSFVSVSLDARALAVSLTLATLTALLFGIVPAHRAARIEGISALRAGRNVAGHGSGRAVFLAAEIAIAVILMAGAVMTLESFRALRETDLGFDTRSLLTARMDLRGERYDEPETRRHVTEEMVRRAGALPGVDAAFLWSPSRLGGGNWVRFLAREGRYEEVNERIEASRHHIYPDTLRRLGIPILRGRDFTVDDRPSSRPVAIVSEALAGRLWGVEPALGKRMDAGHSNEVVTYEVVGVAANVQHRSRLDEFLEADYDVYVPYSQAPERYVSLLLRTRPSFDLTTLVAALRRSVGDVDPNLALYDVATMRDRLWEEEAQSRVSALLVSAYAAVAMALAVVGIYGTLALAVRQRVREIGVRMALGANLPDIVRHVLGSGLKTVFAGAALGLVGSVMAGQWLGSLLYGVSSIDVARLVVIVSTLVAVGLLGLYLPARQASRVDPTSVLREE